MRCEEMACMIICLIVASTRSRGIVEPTDWQCEEFQQNNRVRLQEDED